MLAVVRADAVKRKTFLPSVLSKIKMSVSPSPLMSSNSSSGSALPVQLIGAGGGRAVIDKDQLSVKNRLLKICSLHFIFLRGRVFGRVRHFFDNRLSVDKPSVQMSFYPTQTLLYYMFYRPFSVFKHKVILLGIGIVIGSPVWGQLSISFPFDGAVFQRSTFNTATITIAGSYTGAVERVEARLTAVAGGTSIGWSGIDYQPKNGIYTGSLSGVTGGWYTLEVRSVVFNNVVSTVSLSRVGVGEVFVIDRGHVPGRGLFHGGIHHRHGCFLFARSGAAAPSGRSTGRVCDGGNPVTTLYPNPRPVGQSNVSDRSMDTFCFAANSAS